MGSNLVVVEENRFVVCSSGLMAELWIELLASVNNVRLRPGAVIQRSELCSVKREAATVCCHFASFFDRNQHSFRVCVHPQNIYCLNRRW
jgi:hypothetical protein